MTDESDEDIEHLLAAAGPRKAPAELRATVFAALAAELGQHRKRAPLWQMWLGRAVAASVLFSAATFAGVSWYETRRMAKWNERHVVRSDIAELTATIAAVADRQSAHAVEEYLLSQLQAIAQPMSAAMRRDLEEIQRWSQGGPLADGSELDDKAQKRI